MRRLPRLRLRRRQRPTPTPHDRPRGRLLRHVPRRVVRVGLVLLALVVPGSMVAGTTAMMGESAARSMGADLGGFLPTSEDDALDPFLDPDLLAAVPVGPEEVSDDVENVLYSSEIVDAVSDNGIPEVALDAYTDAADQTEVDDPGCGIRWSLLAAIGDVESNHGRFGGAQLRDDGYPTRPILGIPLDGRPNVARISDTDRGRYDRDLTFDRAVGPMQFIPSTWESVKVDVVGDGSFDPQNMFNATQGAAVYLCRGGGDLRDVDQQARAVRRYNNADSYVQMVLRLAEMYESGDVDELPAIGLPPREPTPRPPATTQPPVTTRPPVTTTPPRPSTTTSTTAAPTTTVPPTTSTTVPGPSTTTTVPDTTTTVPAEVPAPPDTAAVGWAPAMREVVVEILETGGVPEPCPTEPTPVAPPAPGATPPCPPPAVPDPSTPPAAPPPAATTASGT
jgi:hypothetical protein